MRLQIRFVLKFTYEIKVSFGIIIYSKQDEALMTKIIFVIYKTLFLVNLIINKKNIYFCRKNLLS
jgi:hypothetical protein